MEAPRGPIERVKSGTVDYTDRYKSKLENFRHAAKDQAVRQLQENKEWANIARYIAALEGDFWDKRRPAYRSRFSDNQLARARVESLAMYTDIMPTISVTSGNSAYENIGDIISKVLLHCWFKEDLDIRLVEVIDHAMLSHGYWRLDGAPGRLMATACGMDAVMPINSTSNLQTSSAIRYCVFKPLNYFINKFPHKAKEVEKNIGGNIRMGDDSYNFGMMMSQYTYDTLSPAMKRLMRNRKPPRSRDEGQDAFPVYELEELWLEDPSENTSSSTVTIKDPNHPISQHNYWYTVKPKERLYPRKRLIVWGGDAPLYDGPSPYWCKRYPFARLALNPVVWAPGGLSMYRTLLPLNDGINEIGAGIFDTIKKAINQTYAYKRGSIADADWDRFFPDMPGAKLRMNPIANPASDIRALDPPNLPAYVREFLAQYLLPMFDRHAGTFDVNSLSRKKQVPGGEVFEQIRDAQSGPKRLEGRRIEVFLREAGEIGISHILQYFDRRSRYQILGEDGVTWEDFDYHPGTMVPAGMAPEAFWEQFSLRIVPGSLHGASQDRNEAKAAGAYRMGALSLRTFLQKSKIADPEKEMQQISQEHQSGLGPAGGRQPRLTRGARNPKTA